ncbi:MAG: translation elongation factor Ts [Armatimonadetes bacterium]|nr:translation elongation factor Ts [Armatimonadota bacterium]
MAITAKEVQALRELTGAGMMDCKRALTEAEGDLQAAKDILRQRGQAKGAKREGKATGEGTVVYAAKADGTQILLLELNCETDFVGKSDDFRALAQKLADKALAENVSEAEAVGGDEWIDEAVSRLGEKIRVGRVVNWQIEQPGVAGVYVHTATGRVAVAVELGLAEPVGDKAEVALEICRELGMQATAMKPVCLDRAAVPAELVEHEREVLRGAADMAKKPPQIQDKIIDGRMSKFYSEICLMEQTYARDNTKTMTQYVADTAKAAGLVATVRRYERIEVGRGES